jgi:hypothetical protein
MERRSIWHISPGAGILMRLLRALLALVLVTTVAVPLAGQTLLDRAVHV